MNITAANWADYFTGGVYRVDTIDSTQAFINRQRHSDAPIFCTALQQTEGSGQRGRSWQSPPGNLYCSLRLSLHQPPLAQSGLTQCVALTIVQALDPDATALKLKWPNDIFTHTGKCGGILIESSPYQSATLATIGIGLNLVSAADGRGMLSRDLQQRYRAVDVTLDTIMPPLLSALEVWRNHPYLPIAHRWSRYDRYRNREVMLENHPHPVRVHGIDQKGRLLASDQAGLHFLSQVRIAAQA